MPDQREILCAAAPPSRTGMVAPLGRVKLPLRRMITPPQAPFGSAGASTSRGRLAPGPPSTSSVTTCNDTRPVPLTGRLGGLERGGRHGLKPMLRPPSTSSVMMPRLPFAEWLAAHGVGERRANVRRRFVLAEGGRAGMPGLRLVANNDF